MKHVLLMRHASAGPGNDDRARPLTPAGAAEAERIGSAIAARGFRPELALVSPARRARETFEAMRFAFGALALHEDEALYLGSSAQLLARIRQLREPVAHVLLIGHNPGLADLARELAPAADALRRGLAPGACAALRSDAARWRDVAPASTELVAFLRPDG